MSLLRRPVASGVPPELRPRVWLLLAAARLPDMLAHSTCGDAGASYYGDGALGEAFVQSMFLPRGTFVADEVRVRARVIAHPNPKALGLG